MLQVPVGNNRQIHLVRRVHIPESLRNDVGKMRRDEGCVQRPGLVLTGGIAQELQRSFLYQIIDLQFFGPARSRFIDLVPRLLRRHDAVVPGVNRVIALGVQVARQLLLEAVILVGAAEVLFARKNDIVAHRPQSMRPGHLIGAHGCPVIPGADLVDEAPGHEGHARGHAQGRIAVSGVEGRAGLRQPLHVGRLNDGVPVDAAVHRRVFIGHDDENIRFWHEELLLRVGAQIIAPARSYLLYWALW